MILWHNPRCGTSRKALALLRERGLDPQLRLYLADPPTLAELQALNLPPRTLMRWKDAPELPRDMADSAILQHLAANPARIERPILICGGRAVLGRPAEAVLGLL